MVTDQQSYVGPCAACGGLHPDGPCPKSARVGQLVAGKYRIVRLIGQGGMGAVFEARHDMIGRRFAIKFLHPELAAHQDILMRFRREAQASGLLESENIAAVTDFGAADDGSPYIVMEYLEGEDLSRLLSRSGPMPIAQVARIGIQVCRGLEAAHARGIVHRDLKPENLLIQRRADGGELVKILDFGIAKLRSADTETDAATRTGIALGTPYYMPPEQARGEKELDQRADIYALGVILYELLTATRPHTGDNYNSILCSILLQPAPRIETRRANLPPALAELVHRAMAYAPAERFASASELIQALAPFSERAVTPSVVLSPPVLGSDPPSTKPISQSGARAPVVTTPPSTAEARRSPALWLMAILTLSVGGLVALALLFAVDRVRGGSPSLADAPSAAGALPAVPSSTGKAEPSARANASASVEPVESAQGSAIAVPSASATGATQVAASARSGSVRSDSARRTLAPERRGSKTELPRFSVPPKRPPTPSAASTTLPAQPAKSNDDIFAP